MSLERQIFNNPLPEDFYYRWSHSATPMEHQYSQETQASNGSYGSHSPHLTTDYATEYFTLQQQQMMTTPRYNPSCEYNQDTNSRHRSYSNSSHGTFGSPDNTSFGAGPGKTTYQITTGAAPQYHTSINDRHRSELANRLVQYAPSYSHGVSHLGSNSRHITTKYQPVERIASPQAASQESSQPRQQQQQQQQQKSKFYCTDPACASARPVPSFSRTADLIRHNKSTHNVVFIDCTKPRCERKGANGFTRQDHLTEHLRGYHGADIPKRQSSGHGRERR